MASIDILIPTYSRPAALAATLIALCSQTFRDFRVVISDQTETEDTTEKGEVKAALRILRAHGHEMEIHRHLPRRGMAEQRQFLLERVSAPYALYLDDDVIVEVDLVERLHRAIRDEGCGFIGSAVIGLSFIDDVRPHEQAIELWEGRVTPEEVRPATEKWQRHRLHNAANLYHVQQRLGITAQNQRLYRIAWVGGCVLYDVEKLRAVGGFHFWKRLPVNHCGEEVLAQIRVMARYGGCGLIPSGAYHQELTTTVKEREVDAPKVLDLYPAASELEGAQC
jgi:GT2 family glycosyltransferase